MRGGVVGTQGLKVRVNGVIIFLTPKHMAHELIAHKRISHKHLNT
jgi:hypothetical protein